MGRGDWGRRKPALAVMKDWGVIRIPGRAEQAADSPRRVRGTFFVLVREAPGSLR